MRNDNKSLTADFNCYCLFFDDYENYNNNKKESFNHKMDRAIPIAAASGTKFLLIGVSSMRQTFWSG